MLERLEIWEWAFNVADDYLKEFLIGIGPDVPLRAHDLPIVQQLMTVPGHIQLPSFHNFYIDVLFQNGVFFVMIAAYVLASTMRRLAIRFFRSDDPIVRDCLFALLAWLVMWVSHATGWSKPVFIFAQLMGLAHLALFNYGYPKKPVKQFSAHHSPM